MRRFIFLWFLAVGLISLIGAAWIGRSMKLTATGFYESDGVNDAAETVVHDTAEAVAHTLNSGGVPALRDLDRGIDPKRKLRVFVFDPDLHQVSGVPAPQSVQALADSLRPQENAQVETSGGELLAGRIVAADDGRAYRVIVRFPARKAAKLPAAQAWGWSGRIAAVVAAAGLLCIWLAWRLAAPLARLSEATSTFASGDLTARAGATTFPSQPPEYKTSDSEKVPRVDVACVELKRHPHIGLRIELFGVESGRQNADDDVRHVAKRDPTTEDGRVILESSRPQRVAQDGDQRAARPVF
jgi:hypothetical protein